MRHADFTTPPVDPDPRRTGWAEMLPDGLCGDRSPHLSHEHHSKTLGDFWCTADEDDREPYRSERRRRDS